MKTALLFPLVAVLCLAQSASAQQFGGSSYPPAGAGLYTGVAPSLPPPPPDSGYGGNSLFPTTAPANSYQQPQSAKMNSWGASGAGGASLLSYNYIDGGYRYIDPRGNALDGSHGIGVTLSMALFNPFFIKAGFNWTSGTGGNTVAAAANADYDFSTLSVAGGVFMPITEKFHFVGEVGLIYANLDANSLGLSYTDAGIYVRPSLRYQAMDNLEIQGGVTVNSTSDYDSRSLDLGAYLKVMPQLDLNLGADFGDETRTMKAGVRVRW